MKSFKYFSAPEVTRILVGDSQMAFNWLEKQNTEKFNYRNQDFNKNRVIIQIYINSQNAIASPKRIQKNQIERILLFLGLSTLCEHLLSCTLHNFICLRQIRGNAMYYRYLLENYIYFIVLFPSNYILFIILNRIVEYCYHAKIPAVEQCRLDNKLWPWQQDLKSWEVRKKEVYKAVLTNFSIGTTLIIFVGNYFPFLSTSFEQLPNMGTLMWQITFCMIMEDFSDYWLHRTFHHPKIYEKVHKKHHEFYQVIGISAQYSHPIEYIFVTILTTMLGPLLLGKRMHLGTMCFWTIIRQIDSIDAHTGYEFPWCPLRLLPFSTSAEYHHYHHSKNIGNYCSFFTIWDSLCGTNQMYYQDKDK